MNSSNQKNILVLYDDKYTYIKTIAEHLNSFSLHSVNRIFYLPATILGADISRKYYLNEGECKDLVKAKDSVWDFELYDAIVIHYSVRVSIEGYLAPVIEEKLSLYGGFKILFMQDEYENTNTAKAYLHRLKINLLFTCVPEKFIEKVYPKSEFPDLLTYQTLTGYVPDDPDIENHALPLDKRSKFIGYRGRKLPHHYGMLGHEKYIIGERVREHAIKKGISVDISSTDDSRIYDGWYSFLGSCRATLATESGSNIFDLDGTLRESALKLASEPFSKVYDKHFKRFEGHIQMNQISPKVFEAVKTRTALICFEGDYSGVLTPEKHYIELKKNFSNIEEVFSKLNDDDYILRITEQAYNDIVRSNKNSYKAFIEGFDTIIQGKIEFSRVKIISMPIAIQDGNGIRAVETIDHRDSILNSSVLGEEYQRSEFSALIKTSSVMNPEPNFTLPARTGQSENTKTDSPLQESLHEKLILMEDQASKQSQKSSTSMTQKMKLRLWKLLPNRLQRAIRSKLLKQS